VKILYYASFHSSISLKDVLENGSMPNLQAGDWWYLWRLNFPYFLGNSNSTSCARVLVLIMRKARPTIILAINGVKMSRCFMFLVS